MLWLITYAAYTIVHPKKNQEKQPKHSTMSTKIKILALFRGVWMGGLLNVVTKNKVHCSHTNQTRFLWVIPSK